MNEPQSFDPKELSPKANVQQKLHELVSGDDATHIPTESADFSLESTFIGRDGQTRDTGESGADFVGSRFGPYEIQNVVAHGGMGIVFRARHTELGRVVALKMILAGRLASPDAVSRFHAEARAAAKLDHPGIVPIHDSGRIGGQHYFTMAFVQGQDLGQYLKSHRPGFERITEIVALLADAVAYAHRCGVVHRDLKPSNVLMTEDGIPRITDFGLAKTDDAPEHLTAAGQVLGTPGFMPPEQAGGAANLAGPQADVYALGALLYYSMTGIPPFQGRDLLQLLQRIRFDPPAAPRTHNARIPYDLEVICLKCLEKDPQQRISGAGELAEELRRYLRTEPIRSRKTGTMSRAVRWCRRKPLAAGVSALLFVACALVIAVVFLRRDLARTTESRRLALQAQEHLRLPSPSELWFSQGEHIADQLATVDPTAARQVRGTLRLAFAGALDAELRKGRLSDYEFDSLSTSIRKLEGTPDHKSLMEKLNARRGDWNDTQLLTQPFAVTPPVFESSEVVAELGFLRMRPFSLRPDRQPGEIIAPGSTGTTNASAAPLVLSSISWTGDAFVRVSFHDGWLSNDGLGIALCDGDSSVYEFLISSPMNDSSESSPSAVGQSGESDGNPLLSCEIRRNATVLLQSTIPIPAQAGTPLSLTAIVTRGTVSLEVNGRTVGSLREPFHYQPVSGKVGLRWPEGVRLEELYTRERQSALRPGAIEAGDRAWAERQVKVAREHYERAIREDGDSKLRAEAEHKAALCQMETGQRREGLERLAGIFQGNNEYWSLAFGIRIWVDAIRNADTESATAISELVAARFRTDELVSVLSEPDRIVLTQSVFREINSFSGLLVYNPDRLQQVRHLSNVDRLLSRDGIGDLRTQLQVARVHAMVDDFKGALQVVEPLLVQYPDHGLILRNYLRALRGLGRKQEALDHVEQRLSAISDLQPGIATVLLCERVRLLATDGRFEDAAIALELLLKATDPAAHPDIEPHERSTARLLQGFLLLSTSQSDEAARRSWARGYSECRSLLQKSIADDASTAQLHVMMLGSLAGELKDEDSDQFLQLLIQQHGANTFSSAVTGMLNPQSIRSTFASMWQSSKGMEIARGSALETLTLRERIEYPLALSAAEFLKRNAFRGNVNPEEEELLWRDSLAGCRAVMETGTLSTPQVVQLGMAWKGIDGILGWSGVSSTLPKSLRPGFGYIMGHRFRTLNRTDMATRMFDEAKTHADEDDLVHRLATRVLTETQSPATEKADAEETLPP